MKKSSEVYDLILCVFACHTIEKYIHQIQKVKETWASSPPSGVKILFFLGGEGEKSGHTNDDCIYLPGVGNDYMSCSYKQFLGMKYIHDHYTYHYVLSIGTDTYPVLDKLLNFLKEFDGTRALYIGGHGCHRRIGEEIPSLYFHSGGPGFIMTRVAVDKIYDCLDTAVERWTRVCQHHGIDLAFACDVAIAYFVYKNGEIEVIKHPGGGFFYGNHKSASDRNMILSCHNMSLKDFDEFHEYLLRLG